MNHVPFEDCRAKAANARDHIALAASRFEAFLSGKKGARDNKVGHVLLLNFSPKELLPKSVPLAVGDAIHNMRSALDIMAGDVVQQSNKSRSGVYFPFANDETSIDDHIKRKNFIRASPEAIALLKSLRPYKGGNIALRAIHDLDITDKHNFVIQMDNRGYVRELRAGDLTITNCSFSGNGRSDVSIAGVDRISVKGVITELVFAKDKPLAGAKVIETLHSLCDLTEGVIESFAALFSSAGGPSALHPA